jgi:outer membrane immunogenic protein
VGANGGYGWADGSSTATISGGALSGTTGTGSATLRGGVAGGQVGANWQTGALVFGVEADWQWSGQSASETFGCGAGCSSTETQKLPWFATARGRVGAAFDRVLVYATGGAAWTNASDTAVASVGGLSLTLLNLSTTDLGWTAGGGVEVALNNNWSAKLEYLYLQTNLTASGAVPVVGGTVNESGQIKDSIVRAGINFRFPVSY